MNNWLIGGPIIAAVIAGWGYIQTWLSKVRSLFLITVTVDSTLSNAVAFFCWKNMKRVKVGDYKYTSFHNFVRPLERYQHVAYECISQTGTLFFYGWVPLIIGAKNNSKNAPASPRDDQGDFSFTFFRRTLDVDEFMLSAIDLYNKYMLSGFSEKRFYIGREYGTFGMRHDSKDEGVSLTESPRANDTFDMWHLRILRWTPDQIGATIHESGKPFEFLAFPDNVWEAITDVEHWLKSEKWYKEKGIPWKRGWLLYGPPGTGKTSLVRSIGEYLDIPIVSFSLSTFSDREFQYKWDCLKHHVPCIALIEDIDSTFHGRKHVMSSSALGKPMSFETLLNALDGIQDSDGIFTVITTNCVDHLDPALGQPTDGGEMSTRPGRIDKVLRLDVMREKERLQLAKRILSGCPQHVDKTVVDGDGDTPAQFQDRCAQLALREYWRERSTTSGFKL